MRLFSLYARINRCMKTTAFYFESATAQESTGIARGLQRRDSDLLDRLIEQHRHRLFRYPRRD